MSPDLRNAALSDLLTELCFRVIERDSNAVAAVRGMIELISRMTEGLSAANRFRVSETLRDLADRLEHLQAVRVE